MPRPRRSRSAAFLEGFVLPLVAGGELRVGAPLDADDVGELRAEVVLGEGGVLPDEVLLVIEQARQAHAAALWLYPVPTPWDEDALSLAVATHNLLFLSHPDAARWSVTRAARRRLTDFTAGLLDQRPPPTPEAAIARHTVVASLLHLERTDVDLESWAFAYQFRGMTPPSHLRRWPRLRRLRERERQVRWLLEEELSAPQIALLGAILARSPLTDCLSPHRSRPVFGWLRVAPLLLRPLLCRLICHRYLELDLELVGPFLARAFWALTEGGLPPPEVRTTLRLVASLVGYLYAARCLTAEPTPAPPGAEPLDDLLAVLVAAEACRLLPPPGAIGDSQVEGRLRALIADSREQQGSTASNLASRLRDALEG